jgi:hypothetical protein
LLPLAPVAQRLEGAGRRGGLQIRPEGRHPRLHG